MFRALILLACLGRAPPPSGLWYQQIWVQIPALLLHGRVALFIGFSFLSLVFNTWWGEVLKWYWPDWKVLSILGRILPGASLKSIPVQAQT